MGWTLTPPLLNSGSAFRGGGLGFHPLGGRGQGFFDAQENPVMPEDPHRTGFA